jgi:hypothetical protein
MNVTIEMPQVQDCDVGQCAYNMNNKCHARAITVGDGVNAMCDTFFQATPHTKSSVLAGVGACKISGCSFNTDYECEAKTIRIGLENNNARCMTYSPK